MVRDEDALDLLEERTDPEGLRWSSSGGSDRTTAGTLLLMLFILDSGTLLRGFSFVVLGCETLAEP